MLMMLALFGGLLGKPFATDASPLRLMLMMLALFVGFREKSFVADEHDAGLVLAVKICQG